MPWFSKYFDMPFAPILVFTYWSKIILIATASSSLIINLPSTSFYPYGANPPFHLPSLAFWIRPSIVWTRIFELCKKILKDEYEFVLSTHIDKGHIHNHIIFNNVNMVTWKCYQSNKKSYHKIRYQSDKLCKENNLSVIDEHYEIYKKKYKTKGKSWYENEQARRGSSWKSRLQFDIDRMIKQSKDWDEFLRKMA